ncbi:TetR/AcrR family transcriptional regulator [Myxococcota bacterium]|nr:TetR/AcrR family transcriptional regulator [Myxococcota bacterium]
MTPRQPTEERRRQIADAALKVIAEQGLGRFTTQAIAAEVGITDGSLFRHFASKQEIVLAALDRVEGRLFEGFPPVDPDPLARLERFFRARAALVSANPVIARLAFSEELPHAAGDAGAAQVRRWKERSLDFVVACVEEGAEQGRVPRGLPAREIGVMIVGTLMALVVLGELATGTTTVDRTWSAVRRLLGR